MDVGLPARHVRPRGPDAPDPGRRPGSSTPWCGGACPRRSTATPSVGQAPDGSSVRAEYLVAGYGNGAALPDDAKALVRRLQAHLEEFGAFLRPGDPLLLMNGSDHLRPQPWLGRVVAEANQAQDEFDLAVTSLPDYLRSAPTEGLPEWTRRAALGVPLQPADGRGVQPGRREAGGGPGRAGPRAAGRAAVGPVPAGRARGRRPFLDLAWTLMIRNAAHDSICACSVDDVVDAVLHRYAEARHIGEGLTDEALAATRVGPWPSAGPVVVNPSAHDRGGLVEVVVPAVGDRRARHPGAVRAGRACPARSRSTARPSCNMLGLLQGARIGDDSLRHRRVPGRGRDRPRHHPGHRHRAPGRGPGRGGQAGAVHQAHGPTRHRGPTHARTSRRSVGSWPARTDGARVRLVPLQRRHPGPPGRRGGRGDGAGGAGDPDQRPGHRGRRRRPTAPSPSTASPGTGRLVDGGDHGDTYNYSPPPQRHGGGHARLGVGAPSTSGDRCGPAATITSTYTWPDRVDESTKSRVGEPPRRGGHHRRAAGRRDRACGWAPASSTRPGTTACGSTSPCPGRRPPRRPSAPSPWWSGDSTAEGRPDEAGIPTFPSRRFVSAGGLTVVHEGLLEYELVDIGPERAGRERRRRRQAPPWRSPCCGPPGCSRGWA